MEAQGRSVGGREPVPVVAGAEAGLGGRVVADFLDLCLWLDLESLVVEIEVVGVAVPELDGEGGFSCGANALASTFAISRSSPLLVHAVFESVFVVENENILAAAARRA